MSLLTVNLSFKLGDSRSGKRRDNGPGIQYVCYTFFVLNNGSIPVLPKPPRSDYINVIIALFLLGLFRSRTCSGYLLLPTETLITTCDHWHLDKIT